MSLERTPPPAQCSASGLSDAQCNVCKESMLETHECLIIMNCNHVFHKECIEKYLSQTTECPDCHKPCELADLKKFNIQDNFRQNPGSKNNANARGKGRGAMAKRYQTRNVTKNLFNENATSLLDFTQNNLQAEYSENVQSFTPTRNTPNNQTNVNIDPSQLTQIIETSVVRILHNLNVFPNNSGNSNNPQPHTSVPPHQPNNLAPTRENNNRNPISPVSNFQDNFNIRSDKVTSVIQNWNLKFDGSPNGLNVEEFLYRIRSLTADNFGNDFSVICKNLHILLSGKAREWYWRYHKQVENIQWNEFCAAIKYQYKDFKSNFDLREELRNRKMRTGESFDSFFEAVSSILDRLDRPIPENELIEILTKNLRPDIRHELLYVPIYSIAHLRKLVQMRENLMNDEFFRKNSQTKMFTTNYPRRNVAELDFSETTGFSNAPNVEHVVDAIEQKSNLSKCWNCDELGHHWQDCLSIRTIFCYGCGAKSTYKPQCQKCTSRKASIPKNLPTQSQPQTFP